VLLKSEFTSGKGVILDRNIKKRVVRLIVRLLHTDHHLSCLQKTESVNCGMLLS